MDTQLLADRQRLRFCADTVYRFEDLPGAIADRDEWQEKVKGIHAVVMPW